MIETALIALAMPSAGRANDADPRDPATRRAAVDVAAVTPPTDAEERAAERARCKPMVEHVRPTAGRSMWPDAWGA